jgi:hypothetical protein
MAKLTITKPNGERIEISDVNLTFTELKELVGVNGHAEVLSAPSRNIPTLKHAGPDYEGFKKTLTPKAMKFLVILRGRPNGIPADELADLLDFKTANQIGGMAGGGMGKLAARYAVNMKNVYSKETRFDDGLRRTTYKPGKDIGLLL